MSIKFSQIILIVAAMIAIHFVALRVGLYQGTVWVDMPLHFAGGIVLGMVALWLLQRSNLSTKLGSPSNLALSAIIVSFALLGSFIWEALEFSFWHFLPNLANPLKLYSSRVSDVLSDMIFGLLGGVVMATIFLKKS